jgi:hypothetical protein
MATRSSAVLGRDIHERSGDPAHTPALYKAHVLDVSGTRARVIVPGYSGRHEYAGVLFMPRGATDIAVGDEAWVGFNDERDPVIVAWDPA